MQIISFPSHYQLVYVNFDIFSFSLISYTPTAHAIYKRTILFANIWNLNDY